MELRHGERQLKRSGLYAPLIFMLVYVGLWADDIAEYPWLLPLLLLLPLSGLWTARRTIVTDQRAVEYRPFLAWLARLPFMGFLRSWERNRRRSIDLSSVVDVRGEGKHVVLVDRDGETHKLTCSKDKEATEFALCIRALIGDEKTPTIKVREKQVEVKVTARPATSSIRCAYCHDDIQAEETRPCPECGTPHHDDCMRIHQRCAVLGCQGRPEKASPWHRT